MRARRFKFECGSNTSCKLLYSGSPGQINRQGLRMATQDAAAAQLLTGRSRLRECTSRLWEFGQRVLPVGRSGRTRAGGSSRRPQTPSVRPGELQRPKPRPAPTTQRAGPAWAERLSARGRRRRGHTQHGSPWRTRAYERDSGNTHLMPHGLDRVQHGIKPAVRLPHYQLQRLARPPATSNTGDDVVPGRSS